MYRTHGAREPESQKHPWSHAAPVVTQRQLTRGRVSPRMANPAGSAKKPVTTSPAAVAKARAGRWRQEPRVPTWGRAESSLPRPHRSPQTAGRWPVGLPGCSGSLEGWSGTGGRGRSCIATAVSPDGLWAKPGHRQLVTADTQAQRGCCQGVAAALGRLSRPPFLNVLRSCRPPLPAPTYCSVRKARGKLTVFWDLQILPGFSLEPITTLQRFQAAGLGHPEFSRRNRP